jgi:hypothetical protein
VRQPRPRSKKPATPHSREKRSPQHSMSLVVQYDLARSQPHPAVDALPQQVGVADVAGVLLDHVDQYLPQ